MGSLTLKMKSRSSIREIYNSMNRRSKQLEIQETGNPRHLKFKKLLIEEMKIKNLKPEAFIYGSCKFKNLKY